MSLYLFANKSFLFVPVRFVALLFIRECTLIGGICALNLVSSDQCALVPQGVQYKTKWNEFLSLLLFLKLQWGRSRPVCDIGG